MSGDDYFSLRIYSGWVSLLMTARCNQRGHPRAAAPLGHRGCYLLLKINSIQTSILEKMAVHYDGVPTCHHQRALIFRTTTPATMKAKPNIRESKAWALSRSSGWGSGPWLGQ